LLLSIVLAPVCQWGFLLIILWYSEALVNRFRPGFEFWIELNYLAWNLVFLPALAALIPELSWNLEQESKTWNHLLVQPAPRRHHFLVKLSSHLALVCLAQILLLVLLVPGGMLLGSHIGRTMGPVPWRTLFQFSGFSLLASIVLIVFHTWLSKRAPGFGLSLAVALGGTWISAHFAGTTAWMQMIPWGMTSQMIAFFDRWNRHIPWEYVPGSILLAILLSVLGTLDFSRNDLSKRG